MILRSLPNLITLGRMLAVPLMVWVILRGWFDVAFWLFVAAGVSDAVDGFIAKRFDAASTLGGFLDPLADKALLVCAYVALGHEGHLPVWLVIIVVFRDVLIIGGAILYLLLTQTLSMRPLMISKVNTTAQIVLIAAVLADLGLGLRIEGAGTILTFVVAATTLASGGAYLWVWGRRAMTLEDKA